MAAAGGLGLEREKKRKKKKGFVSYEPFRKKKKKGKKREKNREKEKKSSSSSSRVSRQQEGLRETFLQFFGAGKEEGEKGNNEETKKWPLRRENQPEKENLPRISIFNFNFSKRQWWRCGGAGK